jgi:pimeloyl-ACP methyl ester carboxylesterase
MVLQMLLITIVCLLFDLVYSLSSGFSATHHKFGTYFTRWTGEKCQSDAPALVCIHGFGGNADQFRKNLPVFQENGYDSFAFDLLGYGYSDKPDPREFGVNEIYNFETWADQTVQFIDATVHKPCILVCNSIGGLVGLQAAILRPDLVKGLVLINMSLRLLHEKKQLPSLRPLISTTQTLLRATPFGRYFFKQVIYFCLP